MTTMLDLSVHSSLAWRAIQAARYCAANPAPRYQIVTYPLPHWVPTKHEVMSVRNILRVVAERYGVTVADLRSPTKAHRVMPARLMAYWVIHVIKGMSLPQTSRALGRADHTSSRNGVVRINRLIAAGDPATLCAIAEIKAKLGVAS